MGTFRGSFALVSNVLRVASVFLGQAQKSVDGLTVCVWS